MRLTRRQAWLLVGAAAWTWYVWLSRIFNIVSGAGDQTRSTGFKAVHVALALVSVVLLTPVGWIGVKTLRSGRDSSGGSDPTERVPARRP